MTPTRPTHCTRLIPRSAAAVSAVLALTACGSGAASLTAAAPAVLVTDDAAVSRTHEASFLQIDRKDPDKVYLSESELQSGDCRFYRSTDRGRTWSVEQSTLDSPVESEKPDGAAQAPEIAPHTDCTLGSGSQNIRTELDQAPDGTLYYLFSANNVDPAVRSRTVLLARSTDEGRTWQTTVVDDGTESAPAEVEVNFQAHMAIDPGQPERIYVMWRRAQGGEMPRPPSRPFMAVSEDGGLTFGEPSEMLALNPGFDGPRPIVVDDQLFAFYRESAASVPDDAPPAETKLYVVRSSDQGKSWDEPTLLASALDASEPIPLYDRDQGRFHVVYHDNNNGDLDVFTRSSTDGKQWSEEIRLNDDALENNIGQFYPQISQSPSGRLDVAWYDFRDDLNPPPVEEDGEPLGLSSNIGVQQAVYYTSSDDDGSTWSRNVRVNDVPIDRSIGTWNNNYFVVVPISIASWDDRALVSWSDTRNGTALTGTQDIYTAAVTAVEGTDNTSVTVRVLAVLAAALIGAGLALLGVVARLRRTRRQPTAA